MRRIPTSACLALLILAACGGEPPPPAATPPAPAPAADAGSAATKPKKTLEDQRAEFMAGCAKKMPDAPDYCACGWTQTVQVLTPEQLEQDAQGVDFDPLRDRVALVCGRKLPEARIQGAFVKSCVGDNPGMGPFCACTWVELRKTLEPGDMADPEFAKSPAFKKAATDSALVCGETMPEDVVRAGFMQGCGAGRPELDTFCACAWTTVRKSSSVGDIGARRVDMAATRPKIEKSCGKPPAK